MNEEALGRCIQRLGTVFKELGDVFLGFSESLSQSQLSSQTPRKHAVAGNIQTKTNATPEKNTPSKQKKANTEQVGQQQQNSIKQQQSNINTLASDNVVTSPQPKDVVSDRTVVVNQQNPVEQRKEPSEGITPAVDKTTSIGKPSPNAESTITPLKDVSHSGHENVESPKKSEKKKKKKDIGVDSHKKHSESKEKHKKDSKKKKHKHSSEKKKRKHDSEDRVSDSESSDEKDAKVISSQPQLETPPNVSSAQNNIASMQKEHQEQLNEGQTANNKQNGQEVPKKNKRPRQAWNKDEDQLFLQSINKVMEENPEAAEREVLNQLEQDFAGKRSREQLRKHFQSWHKAGRLNSVTPTKNE